MSDGRLSRDAHYGLFRLLGGSRAGSSSMILAWPNQHMLVQMLLAVIVAPRRSRCRLCQALVCRSQR